MFMNISLLDITLEDETPISNRTWLASDRDVSSMHGSIQPWSFRSVIGVLSVIGPCCCFLSVCFFNSPTGPSTVVCTSGIHFFIN